MLPVVLASLLALLAEFPQQNRYFRSNFMTPLTFCNNHVQWPCKKTLHASVYYQFIYTTYFDFPNQFPMTATKQGQQVDWNNPENKQVQEIAIHLKHKSGIYCIGL